MNQLDKSNSYLEVTHVRLETTVAFDQFIERMEKQLGDYEEKTVGSSGFMQFMMLDHGSLLTEKGKPSKARQYLIGNPDLAIKMTSHDLRAALYAPLRCLVYRDRDQTIVEYDLPSSIFMQFQNPQIDKVAEELNKKLADLFQISASDNDNA